MSVASFLACVRAGRVPTRSEMLDAADALGAGPRIMPAGTVTVDPLAELAAFFDAKARWSRATFGAHGRVVGVVAHLRKELLEIEAKPSDLEEWIDVVLLAMDGAWRGAGACGSDFAAALYAKHAKNMARAWPAVTSPDAPIEHVRSVEEMGERISDSYTVDLGRERDEARAEAKRWAERVKTFEERLARITNIACGRGET